ncbi:hypothetical protein [Trichothermofontia sp.]
MPHIHNGLLPDRFAPPMAYPDQSAHSALNSRICKYAVPRDRG